jgi:signal transduction histidine kinase
MARVKDGVVLARAGGLVAFIAAGAGEGYRFGGSERCPPSYGALVREVLERSEQAGEVARSGCPVTLTVSEEVRGSWGHLRVEQVISNLFLNALKYGERKPVELEVKRQGPWAVLQFVDRGVGIPHDEQERIFEKFERGAATQSFGGFGMGLYIARQVVEAHGGTLSVSSQPGAGAVFIVRLPLKQEAAAVPEGCAPSSSRPFHVH